MIPAQLESALAECDALGISLRAGDGDRIVFRAPGGIPATLAATIKANRAALLALLRTYPRPDPDPVLFVARNLDLHTLPFDTACTTAVFHKGNRPYWQVTPAVCWWFARALDGRYRQPDGTYPVEDPAYLAALARLDELFSYGHRHFRPDQMDRALGRPSELPAVEPIPV